MPKSATGATEAAQLRAAGPAGFTLVELLVVLVIAGITAGLVLLRLPTIGGDRPERLLERLEVELETICDQALLSGNARGLRFHDDGYDFWLRAAGQWQSTDRPRARDWPERTTIELDIEGLGTIDSRGSAARPQVICTGIEPPTPFRLRLTRSGSRSGNGSSNRAQLVWPP